MFKINEDLSIHITRGDSALIDVEVTDSNGNAHDFSASEEITLRVSEAKESGKAIISVLANLTEDPKKAQIFLTEEHTRKIGNPVSKPIDFWYEISIRNKADNSVQTVIGYDENGAKVLRLYPEIGDSKEVTP